LSDDGQGPQISIDCAGLAATLKSSCLATRPRGIIVNVAIWEKAIDFNPNLLAFGERRYHSGMSQRKDSLSPSCPTVSLTDEARMCHEQFWDIRRKISRE
jgi:threonine dehydrogenase-like Zn-dependent dehydrogenase